MNSAGRDICAHRLRTFVTLLLFLAFALVHFSAAAQSIAPDTTSHFNIPSQPLDTALADGTITISGPTELVRGFGRWFLWSPFYEATRAHLQATPQ